MESFPHSNRLYSQEILLDKKSLFCPSNSHNCSQYHPLILFPLKCLSSFKNKVTNMSIHLFGQAINNLLLHNLLILSSYFLTFSPLLSNCLHFSPHLNETAVVEALPKSWLGITIRMDREPLATTYPYFLVCLFLYLIQALFSCLHHCQCRIMPEVFNS